MRNRRLPAALVGLLSAAPLFCLRAFAGTNPIPAQPSAAGSLSPLSGAPHRERRPATSRPDRRQTHFCNECRHAHEPSPARPRAVAARTIDARIGMRASTPLTTLNAYRLALDLARPSPRDPP